MIRKTLLGLILTISTLISQSKWSFDVTHSNVKFSVIHLMISELEGNFKKFEGEVISTNDDFTDSKINFTVDVNSIDTDNEGRDKHLKSSDFFSADTFPNFTFTGTSFKKVSEKKYKLVGNFTMKGITKPITLDATYFGTVKDGRGNSKAGFKIVGSLSRKEFGITWDRATETGGILVSDNVDITCHIQLRKN